MRHILKNEFLKVEIESLGAELKSVVDLKTGLEYMWQADPAYWGRTSPVLFPFVGSVVNKHYRFEGKEYSMESHGFAREMEFEVTSEEDNEIWFALKDNEKTYENYPFHFIFQVGYILEGRSLKFDWIVTNPGQDREDGNLYFSIGGHPAFNCPVGDDEDKVGYSLLFEGADEIHHHGNLHGTATREHLVLPLTNNRALIDSEFFNRSTYIIEDHQTEKVAIENRSGKAYVTVEFDTPLFGVWSPIGKNAPFLCIEPWYGRTDYDDFTGDLTQREFGNVLKEDESFENEYKVTFGSLE